jgi:ATP-dependent exoDNAse (exonuclease V) beta subunit
MTASQQRTNLQPPGHGVIRASAGTGKTFELSGRYLRLLWGEAAPETILAVTFTRKAAGEVLERVLRRLAQAGQNPQAAAELGDQIGVPGLSRRDALRMLATVCRSLHRVAISTIDSFFYRMASCFRHELGIPPRVTVVDKDDPLARQLRGLAIDAVLGDEDLDTLVQMLRRLDHEQAGRTVTDLIDQIVSGELYDTYRQNPNIEIWSRLDVPPGRLGIVDAAEAQGPLLDLDRHIPNKKWADAWRANRKAAEAGAWDQFLKNGLAKAIAEGNHQYYRRDIPDEVLAAYRPLVDHARAELIAHTREQTQATFRLLQRFDKHYSHLRRVHGVLLYGDLPLKLARQLPARGDGVLPEVYYRLDARVTHLLLDEFQDTSLDQWGVLRGFAEEIASHADGSRTFFCVGDVKQAIYGWRGGCAELFDHLGPQLRLPPSAFRSLTASFRTAQPVLDAVNAVFSTLADNPALTRVRDLARSWQDRFETQTAADPRQPGYIELVTSPAAPPGQEREGNPTEEDEDDDSLTPAKERHERFVAERIENLARDAPGRTIGVLVTTNEAVRRTIHVLRHRGLTVSGEGGSPITDDPAVDLILSAITMADHPGDTAAAYHVWQSPLAPAIGLRSTVEPDIAAAGLSIRRAILEHGYAQLLTDWARALAPWCDARGALRLAQLIDLADRYDPVLTLRPKDFARYIMEATVEEPMPATIRVMTINKAKGLEFDIVVLPDLQRDLLRDRDAMLYVCRDEPAGPARAVYRAATQVARQGSAQLERAYQQWLSGQFNDQLCKLYVAMTRPRHALHLIVPPLKRNKDAGPHANGWTTPSYAAILRRALTPQDACFDGGRTLYSHGDPDWARRLAASPCSEGRPATLPAPIKVSFTGPPGPARRSWSQIVPSALKSAGRVDIDELLDMEPSGAQLRGTLIHAWLSLIEWLDAGGEPSDEVLLAFARQAAPAADPAWVAEQVRRFKDALQRPAVARVLSRPRGRRPDQLELWRERPFAVRTDRGLIRGVFDRVVLHIDHGRPTHVDLIDFKTDYVRPDRSNLTALVETYRPQLEAYRLALSAMLGIEKNQIGASLLFVDAGEVCEIQPTERRPAPPTRSGVTHPGRASHSPL